MLLVKKLYNGEFRGWAKAHSEVHSLTAGLSRRLIRTPHELDFSPTTDVDAKNAWATNARRPHPQPFSRGRRVTVSILLEGTRLRVFVAKAPVHTSSQSLLSKKNQFRRGFVRNTNKSAVKKISLLTYLISMKEALAANPSPHRKVAPSTFHSLCLHPGTER